MIPKKYFFFLGTTLVKYFVEQNSRKNKDLLKKKKNYVLQSMYKNTREKYFSITYNNKRV